MMMGAVDLDLLDDNEYDAELLIEYLTWMTQRAGGLDLGPPGSAKADGSLASANEAAWQLVLADPRFRALGLSALDARMMTGPGGVVARAAWDSSKHPRVKSGKGGGEFAHTAGNLAKAFEFFGPHGSGLGAAFLPGNREPEVGDMARSDPAGYLVVGNVVSKAGGHVVVEADDGNRYLVDWRNGGKVRLVHHLTDAGDYETGSNSLLGTPLHESRLVSPGTDVPGGKQLAFAGIKGKPGRPLSPEAAKLRSSVESGVDEEWTPDTGGAQAYVSFMKTADGGKAVRKHFHEFDEYGAVDMADAEYLAGQVAEAIGGTGAPPVIRSDDPDEVIMGFAEGTLGDHYFHEGGPDMSGDRAMHIGLLDEVIANTDRHQQNYLFDDHGEPVPIDHSSSFGIRGGMYDSPFEEEMVNRLGYGESPFPPEEVAQIRTRLKATKAAFGDAGHVTWYMAMMHRFDKFAREASVAVGAG
jgi:hypothetical protein